VKLHSIEIEAKNCRKAFKNFPSDGFTLHCHHELLGEPLTEPAENRIAYILSDKPEHEQALRLRLFRPITESQLKSCKGYTERHKAWAERDRAYAEWGKAYAEWRKADAELSKEVHDKFCVKDCPWNGKTIFPASTGGTPR
jgi:hypothetical protein